MLNNILDRIKLPFRKDKELYSALYDILGFYPHEITYYKLALMHKSMGHRATAEELKTLEGDRRTAKRSGDKYPRKGNGASRNGGRFNKGKGEKLGRQLNNERLEFLGDAILDAVVGDVVYQYFPGKPEGFLTNTRSKLVQRETLGKLAQQMGITKLILSSGRSAAHNSYMGGNAFEALVGAIYLDRGYEACQTFWNERIMGKQLNIEKVAYKEVNFKSKILEWSQKNRIALSFRLEDQTQDKSGSPKFEYTVLLEGVEGCRGEGFSKKESQQRACELTLQKLRKDSAFLDSVFAAKSQRTQMDEDPVAVVPDVTQQPDGVQIVEQPTGESVEQSAEQSANQSANQSASQTESPVVIEKEKEIDSLTLDDIKQEKSREDIIAEAEAAAYGA